MGAYKRPLKDGEVCEDSRTAFNPNLGKAVAKEAAPQLEPQVMKVDKPKAKPKAAEVDVIEDDILTEEVAE